MKKTLSFILALAMLLAFAVPAYAENTRTFTDSCGRTVEVPEHISKVAVSGSFSQIVLFALCPDLFAGTSGWDKEAEGIIAEKYLSLPKLGQLYGGKGELNLESLLASGAEIVVDIGEPKKSVGEDMDALTEQTGLPFIHIDAYTATMGDTYRMLGELFRMEEEAAVLADYCDSAYARFTALGESVEKVPALYLTGIGQNVIAAGSYHSEVIDMMAENRAVVESPSGKGTGNEVSPEQLMMWDPEVLFIAPGSIYNDIQSDSVLSELSAVKSGRYYEVPKGPFDWMSFPPSVQRLLGMMWMGSLLYPDAVDYDLFTEVQHYFKLFYHADLTEEMFAALTANSLGKAA